MFGCLDLMWFGAGLADGLLDFGFLVVVWFVLIVVCWFACLIYMGLWIGCLCCMLDWCVAVTVLLAFLRLLFAFLAVGLDLFAGFDC